MPGSLASRLATVDHILTDPPVVHPMDFSASPTMGVWSTEAAAYRFMAERCPPGTRTIETGSGLSTVLFAALGTEHICCTPGREERQRILDHCTTRSLPCQRLRFELGSSHHSLPRLEAEGIRVDFGLVDGSHGFPLPIIDWFYMGSMMDAGGVVVIDDVDLPAVRTLLNFISRDPRWRRLDGSAKWAAFERSESGPLVEDWWAQPFHGWIHRPAGVAGFIRRGAGRARRELARIRPVR